MAVAPYSFSGLTGRRYAVAPEMALLFLASNVHADLGLDARACDLARSSLDWGRLLEMSHAHGVTGLLRRLVRASGFWDVVPEPARQAMDSWHRVLQVRHLIAFQQLGRVLAAAAARDIEPVILKGAAVAAVVYPDPALRWMVDIDLLVGPTQVEDMVDVMATLGYVREELYYGAEFNSARGYHHSFVDPAGQLLPVEIHWDLASLLERRNALSAGALRSRTVRARVMAIRQETGADARVLDTEARIVYLATHAATEGHAFGQLKWLADIAAAAGGPSPPDWPAVAAFARRARARVATYVALALARDLLGAAVPVAILAELRPLPWVVAALERTLNPATILDPIDEERRAIVKYLVVDSPAVTVRLLRERFLPPPDALWAYHPELRTEGLAGAYGRHVAALGTAAARKVGAWLLK